MNCYQPGVNLAAACRRANFKNLAYALNLNSQVLATPKLEFETSEQYAERAGKIASVVAAEQIVIASRSMTIRRVLHLHGRSTAFRGSFSKCHNVWRDVKRLGPYRSRTRMGISATVSDAWLPRQPVWSSGGHPSASRGG